MLCDDPKCLCHPRPKKPFQKLELVLRGSSKEQFCRLDQPRAQLDVVFDLIANTVLLREIVEDPTYRDTSYTICLRIDCRNMRFVNLKGLPNNSLLLSMRMRSSVCTVRGSEMTFKEKYHGFSPNPPGSRLYNDLYLCDWAQQHLELLLPADRIKGWKTVALILKTFRRISAENWCHLNTLTKTPGVAGLDWRAMEEMLLPDRKESSPESSPEEEWKMQIPIDNKKIGRSSQKFHPIAAKR